MLTEQDKAVLAHIVEDPDAWVARALDHIGIDSVIAKCRRAEHVAAYLAAKDEPGYLPRYQRPWVPLIEGEQEPVRGQPLTAQTLLKVEAAAEQARQAFYGKNGWPEPL